MRDLLSVFRAAERFPERPAVITAERQWTFAEAAERSARAAGVLQRLGLRPGDRLPMLGVVSAEALWCVLAALDHGICPVLVHGRWTAAEQKRYLDPLGLGPALDPGSVDLDSVEPAGSLDASPPPETPAAILPTSGSTGRSKGVVLSRRAFLASAEADRCLFDSEGLGAGEGDRSLAGLPLAHVGGLSILTRALGSGGAVVLPPPSPRFDAAIVGEQLERFRITRLSVVPTMLRRLLAAGVSPSPSLRSVLVGGAAAPARLLTDAREAGWPVLATYGLTEACSQVATERPGAEPTADGGVGPLLPGLEGRIVDGVLEISGPTLMSGYAPSDEPGRGLLPDGWLRTGDLARFDERGHLHVLGRADDVIVTGGENVAPLEVELALEEHPSVTAAAVYGVDDLEWGRAVHARITLDPDRPAVGAEALRDFLKDRLARFKIPRHIEVAESMALTASGKLDRRALAAALREL